MGKKSSADFRQTANFINLNFNPKIDTYEIYDVTYYWSKIKLLKSSASESDKHKIENNLKTHWNDQMTSIISLLTIA